jgi:adenine C2-methylase RlmN of 23S rRNA A2503 and tRNA A37
VNHLVFMGMGEPFLNFDEVRAAQRIAADDRDQQPPDAISTVGWLPRL